MKEVKHYLGLLAILAVGFGLYWMFNFNRQVQVWITIGMGCVYVLWGMIYHALRRELYLRIILEYLLVAGLACTVVIFLLLR
ncbi:MAG: hypothetical protein ACPLXP_00590 [Microgenomates group bacterium]